MDPRGGGCGGVRTPPKYFKMPRHAGVGEKEGGGGGVNCVIVTIECIVILGILIFYAHFLRFQVFINIKQKHLY